MKHIPMVLVVLRMVIAVFLMIDASDGSISSWFVAAFIIAAVSDALDGFIARRLHATSTIGSMLDGYADILLYGGAVYCIWMARRWAIQAFFIPLIILASTQLFSWLISFVKYRRITSYHSYIAKAWAVTIFAAIVILFMFNYAGIFYWLAIIIGIVSNLEDITITLLLPTWSHDVISISQAFKIRKNLPPQ